MSENQYFLIFGRAHVKNIQIQVANDGVATMDDYGQLWTKQ